jgi:hypothetical protein
MRTKEILNQDKEFTNLKVKAYILKNIDCTGYENEENTPQNLFNIFKSEQGWNIEKIGIRNAFIEWCKGVPSALNLAYYYDEVNEIMENEFNALMYRKVTTYYQGNETIKYEQEKDDTRQYNKYLALIMFNLFDMLNLLDEDEPLFYL